MPCGEGVHVAASTEIAALFAARGTIEMGLSGVYVGRDAFDTWTAAYAGGWARAPGTSVPGPNADFPPDAPPTVRFTTFPNVYDIPFYYAYPALGTR